MPEDNLLKFRRVRAIHPHWRGALLLSNHDDQAIHESEGSRGRYSLAGHELTVWWEAFAPDHFTRVGDEWVHHEMLRGAVALKDIAVVQAFSRRFVASAIRIVVPEAGGEVELRLDTSDLPTFRQVFVDFEYDSPDLPDTATTIVDLGANIGLATLYFAARYPGARILAVEPDPENFRQLARNTASLGARVQSEQAAAWLKDGEVSVLTEDEAGRPLDAWTTRVAAEGRPGDARTPCYRLSSLLDLAGFSAVDILKVDIEGAELELFSAGVQDCLDRVRLVIVETHDRFRPGSEAAVREALASTFEERPRNGENLFFVNTAFRG